MRKKLSKRYHHSTRKRRCDRQHLYCQPCFARSHENAFSFSSFSFSPLPPLSFYHPIVHSDYNPGSLREGKEVKGCSYGVGVGGMAVKVEEGRKDSRVVGCT